MNRTVLFLLLSIVALMTALYAGYRQTERMADRTLSTIAEHRSLSWITHTSEQLQLLQETGRQDGHVHVGGTESGEVKSEALAELIRDQAFTPQVEAVLAAELARGDVFRFKLFDADGELVYFSDMLGGRNNGNEELGLHNPTAAESLASGAMHTAIEDGRAKPDRPDFYAETYAPLFLDGVPAGTVEVYTDISQSHPRAVTAFHRLGLIVAVLVLAAFALPLGAVIHGQRRLKAANLALANARDEARAAEHAKGRFLANMSHEIRTPMNGVMGMTELLMDTDLDIDQRSYANTIYASSSALLEIINDVLDYSKVEAGQMKIDSQPFDVAAVVQDVAALLFPVANAKGVEVCVDMGFESAAWAEGDAPRIRQCLLNLAGNAVKFTDSGHVLIAAAPQKGGIRFTVEDTGTGIPEDKIDHIFTAFEQVDNNATRRFDGTGLGLAITRRLTDLMGGRIEVRSKPGVGSCFTFSLPLATCPRPTAVQAAEPAGLAGRSVLVVDDLEVNRRILELRLGRWGMKVQTAASAAKAMELLKTGARPDLLVLDYCMPEASGEDLFLALQADADLAQIPCVILTSGDSGAIRERLLAKGLKDLLPKPARTEVLARVLSEALGSAAKAPPPPQPVPRKPATPQFPGLHILLAEDNRTNQIVARKMLEPLGVEVTLAENGQEAVDAYKRRIPDLVLMDVSMPVMGGLDATRRLRELEAHGSLPRCPIIALTANAMTEDRQKSEAAGMDDHLAKPLTRQALAACIARWAPKARKHRESA